MTWLILAAVLIALSVFTWRKPRLCSSIVWALTATIFTATAAGLLLPGDLKNRLVWISLAIPLVWLGYIFWAHWDSKAWRATFGLIAITLIGAIVVWQTPAPVT